MAVAFVERRPHNEISPARDKQGRGGFVRDGPRTEDKVRRCLPGAAFEGLENIQGVGRAIGKFENRNSRVGARGEDLRRDLEVTVAEDRHEADFDDTVQNFKA